LIQQKQQHNSQNVAVTVRTGREGAAFTCEDPPADALAPPAEADAMSDCMDDSGDDSGGDSDGDEGGDEDADDPDESMLEASL